MTNVVKITHNYSSPDQSGENSGEASRAGLRMIDYSLDFADSGVGAGATLQELTQMIVQLRAELDEYRKSEGRFRSIIENAAEGMWQISPDGALITANTALAQILGYSTSDELMKSLDNVEDRYVYPEHRALFHEKLAVVDVVRGFEYELFQRDGARIWVSESARVVRDSKGDLLYYEGVVEDVTARKHLQQEREELLAATSRTLSETIDRADRDPLTGLWNHSALHRKLRESAAETLRAGAKIAIVLIDLDNFRFFNDAYGHMVGDEVLRKVVEALKSCSGPGDTIARYGGDEFAILMPRKNLSELNKAKRHLESTIAGIVYSPPDTSASVPLHLSIGSAVFPDDGVSPIEALALADARLIRAKSGESESRAVCDELRELLSESLEGFSMLDALITAVDNKDRYTRRHSEDVMLYCVKIAQNLGFSAEDLHTIKVSALLHDVGKIGVPDAILRKPAALTVTEFGAIKQHPMMGGVIVAAVPGFENTLDGVRYHHERWDGKGYPCGLAGRETPRIARIMAVADAFSAMTTDRPYRRGMEVDHAREILRNGAGTQWDPECVEAFLHDPHPHA